MNLPENTELRFDAYCHNCPLREITLEEQATESNAFKKAVIITCSHYRACERLYNMNTYGSEVA